MLCQARRHQLLREQVVFRVDPATVQPGQARWKWEAEIGVRVDVEEDQVIIDDRGVDGLR
ncbi:hypothetical protein [Caulobacter sp. UC70_42]|uniref:hypothetical protein n=1 Tax=Caulobacter sp. UC70_42 TaxID=3374551 RepID=UPI003757C11E